MYRTLIVAITALALGLLAGTALAQDKIKVGTTSGADVDILEKVIEVAKTKGLEVEIVEFSDYQLPNAALAEGEIDLNSFQHIPFLEEFIKEKKVDLVSIGLTYISPIGFFSKKYTSIDQLKDGDLVAIPNDPSNGGRALLLLQRAGFITLRPEAGLVGTPYDVEENRLHLKFIEVDASQTPAARDDAAIAAINNTFSVEHGLHPVNDAILIEDFESPYANIIVARAADKDNPAYKKFVESYQSQEVAEFILERFQGATLPLFDYQKK
jgi:D-methionine transport system substrate-binding protein